MKKFLFLFLLLSFSLGQSQTPAAGPATPMARNAWDVLSQYGSAYTNQAGVIFDSFGGSNIVGDETLGDGSIVKKYLSHSYSGIQVNGAGNLNVSGMTHLHMDVWSPDFVSFKVKLEGANGSANEIEVPFAKTQGSWNSYDLDLSTYTGVTLNSLRWIVPVTFNPNNTTLFITNVYFYRPATSIPQPTITNFSVPNQLVGAAPFMITAPTSNSTGSFSYESSNTNVATISGNMITVVGAGSTTIVANQAPDSNYLAGSANASMTVSFAPPMTAAPTPTVPQVNVISLFSDAYTPSEQPGTNWFPNWGQTTQVSDVLIAGNNTKLYSNLNYEGTIFNPHIDASSMVSLHIDVYTPNSTFLNIYPIVEGQPEQFVTVNPTLNSWSSFDLLLSQYSIPLADIKEFKIVGSNGSTVYFDNLYFSNVPLTVNPSITAFSVPAKVTGAADFALTAPTSNSAGAFTYESSDANVATISGNMVTIVGVGTAVITANQAAAGSYNAGSITANLVVTAPLPTTPLVGAPVPTRNAVDVISVFSDTYTSVPTNYYPNWGQGTLYSQPSIDGNPTILYSNLDYQGMVLNTPINAGAMTHLHLDIWTPDVSPIQVFLIANGENPVTLNPTLSGWNSFDIDLTQYSNAGRNLNNVIEFKFVKPNFAYQAENNKVYLDNFYFWKPAGSPTYGTFTLPAKLVGDAAFTIMPPTSSSPEAFTYSSSNQNIATISGSTITITGAGTCIITASQAAGSGFLAGSTTASFVVTFPELMVAAPDPTVPAANVLSIFSDVYTNLTGTNFFPNWGQTTQVSDLVIAGNNTKKYTNLNYQGTEFASAINASQMFRLHFDIYSNDCTSFRVYPIVPGQPEQFVELTPVLAQWNSFDIDLSQYTIPLNTIIQFKIVGTNGSTVYLDNIYFSNICYTETTFYADADGDGFGDATMSQMACLQPSGYVTNNTDCNDANANVNPNKSEVAYNGLDDNCDGNFDEGFPLLTTSMPAALCDTTLQFMHSSVYSVHTPGATAARYRVKNLTTNEVQYLVKNGATTHQWFQFNTLSSYDYSTSYLVDVELQMNGVWLGYYGSACTIHSPGFIAGSTTGVANLTAAHCGKTLATLNEQISANNVSGATGYRFEITNQTTGVLLGTIDRTLPWFNFGMMTLKPVYGTPYTIRVAVKTSGSYGNYGADCVVNTPNVTGLNASTCGLNTTSKWVSFNTASKTAVTVYRFKVTNMSTNAIQLLDRTATWFNFSHLTMIYDVNTPFSVEVAYSTSPTTGTLVFSPYSESCMISSGTVPNVTPVTVNIPVASKSNKSNVGIQDFKVNAFPNPFTNEFNVDLKSNTNEKVSINVYDMIGKLIESRQIEFTEINNLNIGADYQSGVYNVIVSQGNDSKTMRVIKR